MQIIKGTGVDCRQRRLIGKFSVERSVKLKFSQGETRSAEEDLDKDAACRRFYSTSTENILPRKLLKDLETSE